MTNDQAKRIKVRDVLCRKGADHWTVQRHAEEFRKAGVWEPDDWDGFAWKNCVNETRSLLRSMTGEVDEHGNDLEQIHIQRVDEEGNKLDGYKQLVFADFDEIRFACREHAKNAKAACQQIMHLIEKAKVQLKPGQYKKLVKEFEQFLGIGEPAEEV